MNAELYGSSIPSESESSDPVSSANATPDNPRAEMENSVLDALRPLLRPKRKKQGRDTAGFTPVPPAAPSAESAAADGDGELGLDARSFERSDEGEFDDEFDAFAAIGEELERRSRQSATMARVLEQHRQQLQTAEKERDEAYDKLSRVVPVVHETAQALREAMDARKIDEDPARMHRLFMLNGRALDELEKVAVTLFADFLWVKSAWEQYARSAEDARKLRSSLDA